MALRFLCSPDCTEVSLKIGSSVKPLVRSIHTAVLMSNIWDWACAWPALIASSPFCNAVAQWAPELIHCHVTSTQLCLAAPACPHLYSVQGTEPLFFDGQHLGEDEFLRHCFDSVFLFCFVFKRKVTSHPLTNGGMIFLHHTCHKLLCHSLLF